jgi:hypothetical protein
MKRVTILAVCGLLFLSGCVSVPLAPASGGAVVVITSEPASSSAGALPTPSVPAPLTPLVVAGSDTQVTLADDGRTIMMRVGDRFLLSLGENYEWSIEVEDPGVVSRVVNVLAPKGSQGLYEAHRVGQTALTAAGDPPCRKAQPPCMAPSRQFRVEVVVK